jgi:hypothetical protein
MEAEAFVKVLLRMAPSDGSPFIYGRYISPQDSNSNTEVDPKEVFWKRVHENIKKLEDASAGVRSLQKRKWSGLQRLFVEMIDPKNGIIAEEICKQLSSLR